MTEEEIELEIQTRTEFKMNEFMTSVKNRLQYKHGQAFDMTRESNYIWKAYQEVYDVLQKEINLPPPTDLMYKEKQGKAKDVAVGKLMELFNQNMRGSGYSRINVNTIVSIVEKAQRV